MSNYIVTENTPGYLPDDDEPAVFDSFADALAYAAERAAECADCMAQCYAVTFAVSSYRAEGDKYARFDVTTDDPHILGRVIEVSA